MKKKSPGIIALKIILSAVVIFLLFWFQLPPINIHSRDFWSFLIEVAIVCVIINAFGYILSFLRRIKTDNRSKIYIEDENGEKFSIKKLGKPILFVLGAVVIIFVLGIVMDIFGSQFFNAGSYEKLVTLKSGDFAADVSELKMSQIPVVDRDTSETLGKRKLGEISDLVSQFEIANNYTQINYKAEPYRVTPLVYGDIIKWFNNQSEGIPAYITVNMTTQETKTVRLKQGIKYSESEYFMRYIDRYLRFKYPTKIFDNVSFEIDDNGTPYWVASTVEYKIGFWSGRDIGGAVLVNAVTGESQYFDFDDIPQWVDQVYNSDMIVEQLEYNGKYRNGFWNSIFGQKDVLKPTDGYNYLAIDDDVWLYTGMTSVVSDQSNVGFVLVNLRTKDARYYSVPGAEEYSAMDSAEGAVQEKSYSATFPLLLNVSDRTTYFMSLKDDAGLVKMYAFVDVQAYQVVGTGATVDIARENYIESLKKEDIKVEASEGNIEQTKEYSGKIKQITTAVVGGNTKYYIRVENDEKVHIIDISASSELPFMKNGDAISVVYTLDNNGKENFKSIEYIKQ